MMISVSKASYFGGFCREHDICVNFAECYVFIYVKNLMSILIKVDLQKTCISNPQFC